MRHFLLTVFGFAYCVLSTDAGVRSVGLGRSGFVVNSGIREVSDVVVGTCDGYVLCVSGEVLDSSSVRKYLSELTFWCMRNRTGNNVENNEACGILSCTSHSARSTNG